MVRLRLDAKPVELSPSRTSSPPSDDASRQKLAFFWVMSFSLGANPKLRLRLIWFSGASHAVGVVGVILLASDGIPLSSSSESELGERELASLALESPVFVDMAKDCQRLLVNDDRRLLSPTMSGGLMANDGRRLTVWGVMANDGRRLAAWGVMAKDGRRLTVCGVVVKDG